MDITDIKTGNVKEILNAIRFNEGLTKRAIAQLTGLSFSTISNICNELKVGSVLVEEKLESSSVGRMPNKLIFQSHRFCSICLDLQMKNVLGFAILDFRNEVLYHHDYDIAGYGNARDIIAFARSIYEEIRGYSWLAGTTFAGVGVAVSAVFDRETRCLVSCAIPMMEKVPMTGLVEEMFQLPCYVDNEANLCALAIHMKEPGTHNLLYLHISQGVGLGVFSEGQLLRGKNGYAAEISHMPLGSLDRQCAVCGGRHCIETDLCLKAMVEAVHGEGMGDSLRTRWEHAAKRVRQHPDEFRPFLKEKGALIGTVLSILLDLFDPEAVYIGGSISQIFELLRPYIMEQVQESCAPICQKGFRLVCDPDSSLTIRNGINQSIYEKWNPLREIPMPALHA